MNQCGLMVRSAVTSHSYIHCTPRCVKMIEWMNERMNKWTNEGMKEWRNEGMNKWTNERMNEWTNERMDEWTNERMNEWMNEWMNGWMNEWLTEWTNECTGQTRHLIFVIAMLHLPHIDHQQAKKMLYGKAPFLGSIWSQLCLCTCILILCHFVAKGNLAIVQTHNLLFKMEVVILHVIAPLLN